MIDKNTKIYVAGHQGLVGSALIRMLTSQGYNNIITRVFSDLDLRNQVAVDNFFKYEQPEYVFLAAAKVGGILANNTYKAEFIYDNIMIAANVIHASYKYRVKKLLNLGSSCIYPKNAPQPLKEEYLLTGELEPTNEPYAIAKIAAIKLCRYYNEQYGTNFISVMPTNLYGPNDNFNLETAHVLPALLRKFYLAKMLNETNWTAITKDIKTYKLGYGLDEKIDFNNKESIALALKYVGVTKEVVRLWGSGKPYREFLYVDDLAKAVLFLMVEHSAKDIGEIVNIGTGCDLTINELTRLIKDIVSFKGAIAWDNSAIDGTLRKLLDVSRINYLGWRHFYSIGSGLKLTYNWFISSKSKGVINEECI
jgi:GDP-L-fucose synthase